MSLTKAFTAYARGVPAGVTFDFDGAAKLQGADVVAAAGTRMLRRLYRQGLVEKPRVFAETDIVLAIADGTRVLGLGDLDNPGVRIATADPATTAGMLTRMLIGRMPLPRAQGRAGQPADQQGRPRGRPAAAPPTPRSSTCPRSTACARSTSPTTSSPQVAYSIAVVKGTPHAQARAPSWPGCARRATRATLRHYGLRPK